ncbi:YbaK/EbsC family protein [Prosthecomicrobium hirschii]|uniref:YbaK/EbsC family protein n=1 Tax=Prosthecodimorpha hirschii TaxID=665126 RepID=UPI00221E74AD|nr:YbaK/EbsC family protein [Prosthecomicrobium hirschii]MCW1843290.1 YbaK/EbsC family protein [Prosthecomicrobium hirschii]
MAEKLSGIDRVRLAATDLGLAVEIVEMPGSTRTAEDAAAACGCAVGQIVKSLVFVGAETRRPLLLLVSGANRVDETGVRAAIGEALERPDAAYVRTTTGFAIGGVAPIGHETPMVTYLDRDLLAFETVWAAAGSPKAVFAVAPAQLAAATGATVIAVTG